MNLVDEDTSPVSSYSEWVWYNAALKSVIVSSRRLNLMWDASLRIWDSNRDGSSYKGLGSIIYTSTGLGCLGSH